MSTEGRVSEVERAQASKPTCTRLAMTNPLMECKNTRWKMIGRHAQHEANNACTRFRSVKWPTSLQTAPAISHFMSMHSQRCMSHLTSRSSLQTDECSLHCAMSVLPGRVTLNCTSKLKFDIPSNAKAELDPESCGIVVTVIQSNRVPQRVSRDPARRAQRR